MPLAREDNDVFKVEPYVYCGNICGPEHPQFGYGRNSWLSGHGVLDLRGSHPVDPGHPTDIQGIANLTGYPGGVARIQRPADIPRSDLHYHSGEDWKWVIASH